jgi:hypothetical protein
VHLSLKYLLRFYRKTKIARVEPSKFSLIYQTSEPELRRVSKKWENLPFYYPHPQVKRRSYSTE